MATHFTPAPSSYTLYSFLNFSKVFRQAIYWQFKLVRVSYFFAMIKIIQWPLASSWLGQANATNVPHATLHSHRNSS
eukprot:c21352_g1_i1 orf=662-892(-)